MPVNKYAALITGRSQTFINALSVKDLAVLDFSTAGHAVYNLGHIGYVDLTEYHGGAFSASLDETSLALGCDAALFAAAREIKNKGFSNIFLMPSSLGAVLGFDLKALAENLEREVGAAVFYVNLKLDADFFEGAVGFWTALVKKYAVKREKRKNTANILGGFNCLEQKNNHRSIAALLKKTGISVNADNLAMSVQECARLTSAEFNVVASRAALDTAEYLKENFGMPYIVFNAMSKKSVDDFLGAAAALTGKRFSPEPDAVYHDVLTRVANIVEATGRRVICFADADTLDKIKDCFNAAGADGKYFCSHHGTEYEYIDINDFVERYKGSDEIIFTYGEICRYFQNSAAVAYSGGGFRLLTPLADAFCGVEGAYRLFEKLSAALVAAKN